MSTAAALPRFTIIIPTKNRAEYLRHTLRTCMIQGYEPLEVIVSDDGSTDNTREVVEHATRRDPRIRYTRLERGNGMRENFEHALNEVKPGFVIALGGDDGLLPDAIAGMHELLHSTGAELVAWPAPTYIYPGARGSRGQLVIHRRRGTKTVKSQEFLSRQARTLHYLSDVESPMFYVKGVASMALVDRVRKRSPEGRFYSCPTPDGYSGIVLAGEVSKYTFSGRPLSIFGLSPSSQGLAYLDNEERSKASSESFFRDVAASPMHHELASQPYSPLITLMTADYLLTAQDLPGWEGGRFMIDYREVLIKSLRELSHGLYGDDRISRELRILNHIAEQHGLGPFFRDRVCRAKRARSRRPFEGTGVNGTSVLLDAAPYQVHNILDAAYAAQTLYNVYAETTLGTVFTALSRSIQYRVAAIRRGNRFPPAESWT